MKWKNIQQYDYYICEKCRSIFIDPEIMERLDNDEDFQLREYNMDYWEREMQDSKNRSHKEALARMAEVVYYSRISIKHFLDIGGGPGYFLDAVGKYLPNNKDIFYTIETFPPEERFCTKSNNYYTTGYSSLPVKFDAGMCIEVIEHLTPKMLKGILKDLANVSNDGASYIFNSGQPDYVLYEDEQYLDPLVRGHIASYSLLALEKLAKPLGFSVYPIIGKRWACVIEYNSIRKKGEELRDSIWTALPENLDILRDPEMGEVLLLLGLETARAYDGESLREELKKYIK